ncbi:DUF3592 domain-containing protein [Deinococcus arenicola]|uniref:DUF3592 domain-containing protein n=1 Tax=Deinococcus arenicola TaxID=2994950 RepID=A0ABU4DNY3_9DEIO|nr:DUF3592 domain-containing protein [Deinococcus sp. ZS9-10]MDV6373595.1 DUF3592 domain-containing protein [Deinococcus sp. ZS9-10]
MGITALSGSVLVMGLAFTLVPALLSLRWPSTTGQIQQVELKQFSVPVGRSGPGASGLHIVDRYAVGPQSYTHDVLSYDQPDGLSSLSRGNGFSEGRRVKVHYDPRRPQRAVLEPGLCAAQLRSSVDFALLPLGLMLLGFWTLRRLTSP